MTRFVIYFHISLTGCSIFCSQDAITKSLTSCESVNCHLCSLHNAQSIERQTAVQVVKLASFMYSSILHFKKALILKKSENRNLFH